MLARFIVDEIRQLLADTDLSQRKIAVQTGVSRGSVSAIASEKRPDYEPRLPKEESWKPTGPKERCPICGGMVYMPCRACELRSNIASGVVKRCFSSRECYGSLQLDLQEEHRRAYEEVRARREKAEIARRSAKLNDVY